MKNRLADNSGKLITMTIILFFNLTGCSFPLNEVELNTTYSHWMGDFFPAGEVSLNQLSLPGTHDSATEGMTLKSDYARNFDSVKIKGAVYVWSKTQSDGSTIYKQLKEGIRYLDIRVEKNESGYFTHHGLVSDPLDTIIEEITQFLSEEPSEIIIADFQHLTMDSDEEEILREKIRKSSLAQYGAKHGTLFPYSKLNEFRIDHKTLIMTWPNESGDPLFWNRNDVIKPWWPDSPNGETVVDYLFEKTTLSGYEERFVIFQTVVTPDAKAITQDWFHGVDSLYDLVQYEINWRFKELLPALHQNAIKNQQHLNITIADFYQTGDYLPSAIELNRPNLK